MNFHVLFHFSSSIYFLKYVACVGCLIHHYNLSYDCYCKSTRCRLIQHLILFHNNISLILCFYPALQNQRAETVCNCCLLILYSIILLNIVCLLYFDLCYISVYALKAPRQMSFGSLGSPSENKDVIIIIIIIISVTSASSRCLSCIIYTLQIFRMGRL